jgi:hypothetical protein
MNEKPRSPIFGAAVLKLSFLLKGIADQPGFRVVYFSTLKELGLKDSEVNEYILKHRPELEKHIKGEDKED